MLGIDAVCDLPWSGGDFPVLLGGLWPRDDTDEDFRGGRVLCLSACCPPQGEEKRATRFRESAKLWRR